MGATPMSEEEIHTARLLRSELKSVEYIAKAMGRGRTAIAEAVKGRTILHLHERHDTKMVVPDSVIADRDRRYGLVPRDLTAALAGDPLPGMSALERRR